MNNPIPLLPSEDTIKGLTGEEAEAMWRRLRWPETDGKPVCPACGGVDHYSVGADRKGRRWRCKSCSNKNQNNKREISLTGGTPFANHKVPLQHVLMIISIVQHSNGDLKILRVAKRLGWGYKTVYFLVGRASEILARGIEGHSIFIGAMSQKGTRYAPLNHPRGRLNGSRTYVTQPELQCSMRDARRPDAEVITRSAQEILTAPRYPGGLLLSTHSYWTTQEKHDLAILAAANIAPDKVGIALGRSAASIAWRAKDALPFTIIPQSWRIIFTKTRFTIPAQPRLLSYPYLPILTKSASFNGAQLTLDVSALVSRAYPDFMRADICQIVLLAILEGNATLDGLRGSPDVLRTFVRSYRKDQDDSHVIQSLDAPKWSDDDRTGHDSVLPQSHSWMQY